MSNSKTLLINNSSSIFNPKTQSIADGIDTYSLKEIPDEHSAWVQEARDGTLFHINLEDLINDLSNAADLIYLASNASKRTDASIELLELQGKLSKLYGKCIVTMKEFADNSGDASLGLKSAFKKLFNGEEDWAIGYLNDIALVAREMSSEATQISDEFNSFKLEVQDQSKTLQLNVITSYNELDELKNSRNTLQANVNKQRSLEKDLSDNLAELIEDLEEAKTNAKDQETKAFVMQILGGLFSAVGAGLSAYSMSKNPVAMVSKVAGDSTKNIKEATQTVSDAKKDLSAEQKKELEKKIEEQKVATTKKDEAEADIKDLEKAIVNLDDETEKIEEEQDTLRKEIRAAKATKDKAEANDNDDKKKTIEIAEEVIDDAENRIDELNFKIKNISKTKTKREKKLKESKKDLLTAEEKWQKSKAAVDAFSAGLNKLSETVDKMSVKAEKRAQTARDTMTEILKIKREVQKDKRAATAEISELIGKIKGNNDRQNMKKDIIHCLEISIWSLMNLFVAFERASFFWSNIARAAEKLSEPKIQNLVREIIKNTDDLDERIQLYKSEDFTRMSISTVVGWKALNSICVEYLRKADEVSVKVQKNISNWLTLDEAIKGMDMMKNNLQSKLSLTKEESEIMDKELEKNIEEIKTLDLTKTDKI